MKCDSQIMCIGKIWYEWLSFTTKFLIKHIHAIFFVDR